MASEACQYPRCKLIHAALEGDPMALAIVFIRVRTLLDRFMLRNAIEANQAAELESLQTVDPSKKCRPTSEDTLKKLAGIACEAESEKGGESPKCSICQEEAGGFIRMPCCGQLAGHWSCLHRWFKVSNKCPLCQDNVDTCKDVQSLRPAQEAAEETKTTQ